MQRTPVKSSNLKEVGYDEKSQMLEILFNDKAVHQYLKVPKMIHDGLMGSQSKGKYFAAEIKNKFKTVDEVSMVLTVHNHPEKGVCFKTCGGESLQEAQLYLTAALNIADTAMLTKQLVPQIIQGVVRSMQLMAGEKDEKRIVVPN